MFAKQLFTVVVILTIVFLLYNEYGGGTPYISNFIHGKGSKNPDDNVDNGVDPTNKEQESLQQRDQFTLPQSSNGSKANPNSNVPRMIY